MASFDRPTSVPKGMQATYDAFVEKAAAGRNTTPELIDGNGHGRGLPGS